MDKSKYSKLVVMDKDKAFITQCFPNFKGARQLNEDKYIVEKNYRYYTVDTALQKAVFALYNAKFWYIKFVYHFMYKSIDRMKVYFIEGDTRIVCTMRYLKIPRRNVIRGLSM
jgi:hypothetical protein